MQFGARFYLPRIGRFASADSIVPSFANPQALNRYAFVLNNPLKYTDPSGHMAILDESNEPTCGTCIPGTSLDDGLIPQGTGIYNCGCTGTGPVTTTTVVVDECDLCGQGDNYRDEGIGTGDLPVYGPPKPEPTAPGPESVTINTGMWVPVDSGIDYYSDDYNQRSVPWLDIWGRIADAASANFSKLSGLWNVTLAVSYTDDGQLITISVITITNNRQGGLIVVSENIVGITSQRSVGPSSNLNSNDSQFQLGDIGTSYGSEQLVILISPTSGMGAGLPYTLVVNLDPGAYPSGSYTICNSYCPRP
jgi:hypothetical protein